jgi:protein-S-isoprenylcysteine O-methyltransferase Ste14
VIAARHFLAIALLPFTVTVLVPAWLARRNGVVISLGSSFTDVALQSVGLAIGAIGLLLFATSLGQFVMRGHGTLAPWDPPKHLVVEGPYRYVRNPMISGVVLILVGEALVLRSAVHGWWAFTFFCINSIYIPLLEEPPLRSRFGGAYVEYCRHVGRLIPRLQPWTPATSGTRTRDNE